jgi:hypothetical protein
MIVRKQKKIKIEDSYSEVVIATNTHGKATNQRNATRKPNQCTPEKCDGHD